MTDNEIIKALELCGNIDVSCKGCIFVNCELCRVKLAENAYILINRQQAKIEALQMDNAQLQSDVINANMNCEYADKEVIRLQAERDFYYKTLVSQQNTQSETALNYGAFQEARQTAIMKHIQSDNIRLEKLLEEADVNYNKCAKRFYKEGVKDFAEIFLKKVHDNHYVLVDQINSKDYGMFTIGIEQAVDETKKEMIGEDK